MTTITATDLDALLLQNENNQAELLRYEAGMSVLKQNRDAQTGTNKFENDNVATAAKQAANLGQDSKQMV